MLEIEKQQRRFADESLKKMIKDYDRNFLKTPKEKPLPLRPPEEGTQKKESKDKKSG
jgi:hypothetical protein